MLRSVSELEYRTELVHGTAAGREIPFGAMARVLRGADAASMATASMATAIRTTVDAYTAAEDTGRHVVAVDDAHLLDPQSAALLHALAADGRVRVVLTVDTEADAPDAVTAVWKDLGARWVAVRPLGVEEVAEVLSGVLGGPVDAALVHAVAHMAQGNPLWVRELVRGACESSALSRAGSGLWQLVDELPFPARLHHLACRQWGGSSQASHDVAVWLAVAGGRLPLHHLERVADWEAIAGTEAEDVVTVELGAQGDAVRLAHPLHGMFLRHRTPNLDQRRWRGLLAESLLADPRTTPAGLARALRWRGAGGAPDEQRVLEAARVARDSGDYHVGMELAGMLEAGERTCPEAAVIAGECRLWLGRAGDAEACFQSAIDVPGPTAAVAAVGSAARLFAESGRAQHSCDQLAAAAREADEPLRGVAVALRAGFAAATGRVDEALAMLDSAAGAPRPAFAEIGALTAAGRPLDAVAAADRPGRRAGGFQPPSDLDQIALVIALGYAGDHDRARQRARAGYREAVRAQHRPAQAMWAHALGELAELTGDLVTALPLLVEASTIMRAHPVVRGPPARARCLADVVEVAGLSGRRERAARALAEAAELPPDSGRVPRLVAARARWGGDDAGEPADALWTCAADAQAAGARLEAARSLLCLARLGFAEQAAQRLDDLAGELQGPVAALWVRFVRVLAEAAPEVLLDTATALREHGLALLAVEAAASAAVALRRAGRFGEAAAVGCRVLCVDEFGPLDLLPRKGKAWRPAKRPERLRATYTRTQGATRRFADISPAVLRDVSEPHLGRGQDH
nr:hypothetical protein [Saccharopolyspora erythraea]